MRKIYTTDEIIDLLMPIFTSNPIDRVILFGSYAKGNPTQSSDIDILIDSNGKVTGIDFFGILEDITEVLDVPVDMLEASQIINGSLVQLEIEKTGVVIYEKT